MRTMLRSLTGLVTAALLASCTPPLNPQGPVVGSPDGNGPGDGHEIPEPHFSPPRPIAKLGIAGAKSLFIAGAAPQAGYRTASVGGFKLYRSNADGSISEVSAVDAQDQEIASLQPEFLSRINETYLYLKTISGRYVVRISDGKSAQIEAFGDGRGHHEGDRPVVADQQGRVYYVHDQVLKRLELPKDDAIGTDADVLVKTHLTHQSFEKALGNPVVDADGNVLISVESTGNHFYRYRIYKAQGGMQNLMEGNIGNGWVGPNGKLYLISDLEAPIGIFQLTIPSEGQVILTPLENFVGHGPSGSYGIWDPVNMADRTVSRYGMTNILHFIQELDCSRVALPKIKTVDKLFVSGKVVIALGSDASANTLLIRYDVETETPQVLFDGRDYQIMKVASSPAGELVLSVLKYADNTYAVGTLNADGSLSFLNGSLPPIQEILPLR